MADSRLAVALSDVQAARASSATDPTVLQALEDAYAQASRHRDAVYATAALRATTVQTLIDMRAQVDAVSILSPSPCLLLAATTPLHAATPLLAACCMLLLFTHAPMHAARCSLAHPCMLHAAPAVHSRMLLAVHALTRPCPLLPRPCHRSRSMNSCTERTSSFTMQGSSSTTPRTSSTTPRTSSRTPKANCTMPTTRSTS